MGSMQSPAAQTFHDLSEGPKEWRPGRPEAAESRAPYGTGLE